MLDIRLNADRVLPILQSLPFQLGIISIGLFFLLAFGSLIVTANPVFTLVGLKVSFFDLFIAFLVFVILMALN